MKKINLILIASLTLIGNYSCTKILSDKEKASKKRGWWKKSETIYKIYTNGKIDTSYETLKLNFISASEVEATDIYDSLLTNLEPFNWKLEDDNQIGGGTKNAITFSSNAYNYYDYYDYTKVTNTHEDWTKEESFFIGNPDLKVIKHIVSLDKM